MAQIKNERGIILTKDIHFIDIQRIPDETIEQRQVVRSFRICGQISSYEDMRDFFEKAFTWISEIELHNGREYTRIIVRYMFDQLDTADKDLFIEAAHRYLAEETRGEIMTLRQAFILEGRQGGRLNGIREMLLNMLGAGMKKEDAAKIAKINLRELEELLKDADTVHYNSFNPVNHLVESSFVWILLNIEGFRVNISKADNG